MVYYVGIAMMIHGSKANCAPWLILLVPAIMVLGLMMLKNCMFVPTKSEVGNIESNTSKLTTNASRDDWLLGWWQLTPTMI
mmetsp:Transcript_23723/g.26432  ORF Transcript_23723/g.26432 Transcript_23723/m.26432 type:complete len:81 (+) Transcript_23723:124-366(+)